jgi:hypothetical protein
MRYIFVFFISFVAYATGAVAVHPAEMLLVGSLLILIGLLRPARFSARYTICAALAMLMIGAITARITLVTEGRIRAGTREFESLPEIAGPRNVWKPWLDFSRALVDFEFRLLLVAIYLFIIGPFAIAFRLVKEKPRPAREISNWIPRNVTQSLTVARRPF